MDAYAREKLLGALRRAIPKKQIIENAPMSRYTTLKLGGPADVLAQIANVEQLSAAYAAAREAGVQVCVLGNGSNLLVRDGGVRGLVIQLGELSARYPIRFPCRTAAWRSRRKAARRCKSCVTQRRITR